VDLVVLPERSIGVVANLLRFIISPRSEIKTSSTVIVFVTAIIDVCATKNDNVRDGNE
jgi:hypothetical protein